MPAAKYSQLSKSVVLLDRAAYMGACLEESGKQNWNRDCDTVPDKNMEEEEEDYMVHPQETRWVERD